MAETDYTPWFEAAPRCYVVVQNGRVIDTAGMAWRGSRGAAWLSAGYWLEQFPGGGPKFHFLEGEAEVLPEGFRLTRPDGDVLEFMPFMPAQKRKDLRGQLLDAANWLAWVQGQRMSIQAEAERLADLLAPDLSVLGATPGSLA